VWVLQPDEFQYGDATAEPGTGLLLLREYLQGRRFAGSNDRIRGFFEEGIGRSCDPRVCPSKIPSFLAGWRVRGPAGTGSVGDSVHGAGGAPHEAQEQPRGQEFGVRGGRGRARATRVRVVWGLQHCTAIRVLCERRVSVHYLTELHQLCLPGPLETLTKR